MVPVWPNPNPLPNQPKPGKAFPFDKPPSDPVADFDRMNGYVGHPLSPVLPRRTSWICPMCTLHNSINVTRCEACNANRNDIPQPQQQPSYQPPIGGWGQPYPQPLPSYPQPVQPQPIIG